jgi:D-alanyl-D-alanine carboxypeptidase/D-alanyl-D-alanine-endopeptidase (penicillin-binding protein 4)
MYKIFSFILVQNVFFLVGSINPILLAQTVAIKNLSLEVTQLSNDPLMKYGQLGLSIQSLKTGETILSENAIKNMPPASNLKLLTTAASLKILGENYVFKTSIEYDGEIKDSVLSGNIYITGGGDPTLGCDRYKGSPGWEELIALLTKKIKEAGIKKINGGIIADPTIFDMNVTPDNWPWGDIGNYYGAGIFGLNINENLYRFYFKGTYIGDSAKIVKMSPELKDVKIINEVKTGAAGSGDNAYIYSAPRSNFIYANGTIPANTEQFAVRGAIPDPPLLCATLLNAALINAKIKTEKKPEVLFKKNNSSLPRKIIYTCSSPALKDILKQTNVNSINLNAEALLKACGVKKNNDASTGSGVKAIQDFWKQTGLETTGWFMYDGSGLSPNNGISPYLLARALYLISKDSSFNSFYSSFPIAGQSGTVARIGKGTAADGNMRIKSGTLSKVICYSGYFKSKSGEMYCFSLLTNNYNCSNSVIISRLEKIMVKMAEMP